MPTVTYDRKSFMLDGRRIWISSASMHFARMPREQWADRIHAARLAGCNTVEVSVFWNRHEPRPGQFDFTGDNDLRHFIELVGQAGLWCILRPGPYVGSGWDMGGLPAWLTEIDGIDLRTANGPFLEACSRYITALADQIRDLQVTSTGEGGPILLVQNESDWTCGDDALAAQYLGELSRYLREAGLAVPTINANNLWNVREGEVNGWYGREAMLSTTRQLGVVNSEQPRLIHYSMGEPAVWEQPEPERLVPMAVQRRLVEILAGGGQFNIRPFHGGTNFGFWGGRLITDEASFVTTSHDCGSPLTEWGATTETFHAIRRISTFASTFGRVLANLDTDYCPIALDPASLGEGSRSRQAVSIVHATGSQGDIAFVFAEEPTDGRKKQTRVVDLLLPDGSTLPVPIGQQAVAWCLFDVHLGGRATLDYSTLSIFGMRENVLVAFGPAGDVGMLSINGSPLEIEVPKGKKPLVIEHEHMHLVICNEDQIDATFITDNGVYVGVAGVTALGDPVHHANHRQCMHIDTSSGESTNFTVKAPSNGAKPGATTWERASIEPHLDGSSPRYAAINGPDDLTKLGTPFGYGWYRITFKSTSSKKMKVSIPECADRLHVMCAGAHVGVVDAASGDEITIPLKKGEQDVVVLAENLGRFASGANIGERKGLFGHLYETAAFKIGKGKVVDGDPIDLLKFKAPLWDVRANDVTASRRISWSFTHRKKAPILITFERFVDRAVVILNDEPIEFLERGVRNRLMLDQETLNRGANTLQLAIFAEDYPEDEEIDRRLGELLAGTTFLECVNPVSEKADWAYAKWEAPAPSAFENVAKSSMGKDDSPCWWRTSFTDPGDGPIAIDLTGMTRGQIFLNDRHVGRYVVGASDGKALPPQTKYYLPEPWLRERNDILIFDEFGGNPSKTKLVALDGPVVRA